MKRFLRKKKKPQSTEMSLQITSMADIFTILLVFLLKSYAVGALEVQPSRGLKLPTAQKSDLAESRLALEVSENSVQLDGSPILPLKGFEGLEGNPGIGHQEQFALGVLLEGRAFFGEGLA